ncbi:hypothetical protein V2S66_32330 [Streptomyces sp. V4-01]|uniref:Lipoprotein n=1 Tax=Actinacidiphila polyblastidii TaxID=3110430 RepID=A0ABU7PLD8_9ACTN|nr:hypothetical protein [Streptomyces sp. V4-01]
MSDVRKRPQRRGPARLFRTVYGQPPLHLLILLASFALCGYAAAKLLDGDWRGIAEWFVGAALIHDLVLVPLYGGTDWLLHRVLRVRGGSTDAAAAAAAEPDVRTAWLRLAVLNHVRVPAFVSLLLLLVYWPLISQDAGPHYQAATLLTPGVFLGRWLLITAALFAASAALLGVRWWRVRGHRRPPRPPVVRSHRPQPPQP